MGLGLAIVKEFVNNLNGKIKVTKTKDNLKIIITLTKIKSSYFLLTTCYNRYIIDITEKVILMSIIISNSSSDPIFLQIKNAIKEAICKGELKEGTLLPSVRALATDLKISFLTVKRAYDELEKEGFIKTIASKGSFVAPTNLELIKEEKLKEIQNLTEQIYKISKLSNISLEEVEEIFNIIFKEEI